MTEQPNSSQTPAAAQLKQLLEERVRQGAGAAATLAGQQAGVMAQAVRQSGEEMRQQGQENQGKMADKVAQPVQRWSASLSQFDPQQLDIDPKQVKPQLTSQLQKAKTQAAEQISQQVTSRAAQAGQAVTSLTDGIDLTGQQLRAQNQEVPALLLDVLVEKIKPLSGYLSSADSTKVRSDIAAYRQQAKMKLSTATGAVSSKRQAATAKGTQVVKQTASGFRQNPVLPAVSALVVAVAIAARRGTKPGSAPTPAVEVLDDSSVAVGVSDSEDLDALSRSQLRERAEAAGIVTDPNMTKSDLRAALDNA